MFVVSDTLGLLLIYPIYKNLSEVSLSIKEWEFLSFNILFCGIVIFFSTIYSFLIFLIYPLLLINSFKMKIQPVMFLLLLVVISILVVSSKTQYEFFLAKNSLESILILCSFLITLVFITIGSSIYKVELENTRYLTIVDTLTKAFNRKAYKKRIEELFNDYQRYSHKFSIILLDLDNFKKINDEFGHHVGDKVLIDLTLLIQDNIRVNDSLYRIGGEEFIILLPNTQLNDSVKIAQKIRKSIETSLNCIKNRKITASLGVSEVTLSDDETSLFQRIDNFQYYSKNNGKNRVTSDLNYV